MNRYAFFAAALTMALYAAPAASPARAAGTGTIQRCQAADGTVGYTYKSCAVFDQRTVAMNSIVVDDGPEATLETASLAAMDAGARRPVAVGRRSLAAGCARSPTQLQMDLRGAFALGDVNRLAESYHWAGMSNREGQRTLDRLGHLLGRRAVASRYFAAQIASLGDGGWGDGARGGDAGILQVVFADDGMQQALEFDVHRYRDCYFVSF